MSACLLVIPMSSSGDHDWSAEGEFRGTSPAASVGMYQGQVRPEVFYHTFPGYLICTANKDHGELPEGKA